MSREIELFTFICVALLAYAIILAPYSAGDSGNVISSEKEYNGQYPMAAPEEYVHRPIVEFFTGLGCSVCQNGADQAMDKLYHESLDSPGEPYTMISFHLNAGGDDALTIPESESRAEDYHVQGTPDAEFDGGFRHILGGEDGEEANYQSYEDAISQCYNRDEDSTINPLDDNFKYVNLQVFQEFSGDGYKISVKVEYLGSARDLPGLGILPRNSPDLHGSLYIFMTEDNVTAWSSERNEGEYVVNNAVFRGFAIKDEQFELLKDETYETSGEWKIPHDAVIPIKPGDITAVAAVYDLDDTSSGRTDGGNPANTPRAIQSATPLSTAYDIGSDIPKISNVNVALKKGNAEISAEFNDNDGISKALVVYSLEGTNTTSWISKEMQISGGTEGTASIPLNEGEDLYYQILCYDSVGVEGKTSMLNFNGIEEKSSSSQGFSYLTLGFAFIGLFILIVVILFLSSVKGKDKEQEGARFTAASPTPAQEKKSKKLSIVALSIVIIIIIAIVIGSILLAETYSEAPDFTLTDIDGNSFTLSDFEGEKVVILDFMAIDCSGCSILTDNLKGVYSHYDQSEVEIISISVDPGDSNSELDSYMNSHGANWRCARDTMNVRGKYGAQSIIPKLVIVDKEGYITFAKTGAVPTDEIIDNTDEALAGTASPVTIVSLPIVAVAFVAGVASFFSPCSFPMLPGFIGYYLSQEEEGQSAGKSKRSPIKTGIIAASGLLLVYLILGALALLIGMQLGSVLTDLLPVIAIILIILGILMLTNVQYYRIINPISNFFGGISSKAEDGGAAGGMPTGSGGMFLYGIGYGAAAAGCTLPLVIGTFLIALSSGLLIGLIVVLVFSFSAAGLMVLVTFLVGTSRDTVVNKLKASTETIKKLGGLLMIVGGIVVIIYWYFAH